MKLSRIAFRALAYLAARPSAENAYKMDKIRARIDRWMPPCQNGLRWQEIMVADLWSDPVFLAELERQESELEQTFAPLRVSIRQCAILTGEDMSTRVH